MDIYFYETELSNYRNDSHQLLDFVQIDEERKKEYREEPDYVNSVRENEYREEPVYVNPMREKETRILKRDISNNYKERNKGDKIDFVFKIALFTFVISLAVIIILFLIKIAPNVSKWNNYM